MKKYPKHFSIPVISFVIFFVSALGVAAGALIVNAHGGDSTKIHGCKNNISGVLRVVGENEDCRANETSIDWNIQGIPGPSGTPGQGNFVCSSCAPRDLLLRLNRTDFQGVNLDQALISQILIQNTDFNGSSFAGAVLANAQGENANFSNANFSNANLRSFNAPYANFSDANLSGADVHFANFFGANMTNTNLTDVIWDSTTCPDGTSSNNNGDTCEGHL